MLTLGLDTSTDIAAVGLADEKGLKGELNISLHHQHSERLMVNIEHLLKETDFNIKEVEGLAVGIGPGSFTGLRIGITTVKTFAQSLKIPVIGLSTLDILAFNKHEASGILVPVIDARRERVYTSWYYGGSKDMINNKIKEDQAVSVKKLIEYFQEAQTGDKINADIFNLVGNGINSYKNQIKKYASRGSFKLNFGADCDNIPRGGVVAELGNFYLEKGKEENPMEITPRYLKKPQAQIDW